MRSDAGNFAAAAAAAASAPVERRIDNDDLAAVASVGGAENAGVGRTTVIRFRH